MGMAMWRIPGNMFFFSLVALMQMGRTEHRRSEYNLEIFFNDVLVLAVRQWKVQTSKLADTEGVF